MSGAPFGAVTLKVAAYGYTGREIELVIRGDTSIVISLGPSPIPLDPLLVENRTITVRGRIHERGSALPLNDAEVRIEPDREDMTGSNGHFELEDVPAGPPLQLSVRAFGYLPIESIVPAFEDTTLVIHLEQDPVAQRMIRHQVERLEKRALPFFSAAMPAMDREYLLRNRNWTALDLVRHRYGQFLRRVQCILIDDRQRLHPRDGGWRGGPGDPRFRSGSSTVLSMSVRGNA